MKVEILDNCEALSVTDVIHQLEGCGALDVGADERIGESRLECGCDLDIDIMINDPSDMRIHGCLSRTVTFTLGDIRTHFTESDYYTWAKDENGDDILLCLN